MSNCFSGVPNNLDCCVTLSVCFFQCTFQFFTDIGASSINMKAFNWWVNIICVIIIWSNFTLQEKLKLLNWNCWFYYYPVYKSWHHAQPISINLFRANFAFMSILWDWNRLTLKYWYDTQQIHDLQKFR